MRHPLVNRLLWAIVAIAAAVALLQIAHLFELLLFLGVFGVFTSPGWPVARWLAGARAPLIVLVPLALLTGYIGGMFVYLAAQLAGQPTLTLIGCGVVAVALTWRLHTPIQGRIAIDDASPADATALAVLLLVVIAIVGPVFAHVGMRVADGLAYRAYFIADLFAHMSVTAELAKSTSPVVNPYHPAEALPYYWSFFTAPAVFHTLATWLGRDVLVDRGILMTDLVMAGTYASTWFLVLRAIGLSTLGAATGIATVLLASSFEGTYFLWHQFSSGGPLSEFRFANIDATTRWLWDLPPVDGLHRLFWYTPQHGFAITLGLLWLAVNTRRAPQERPADGILDGLLLGAAFLVSSFNGILLVIVSAVTDIGRLVGRRDGALGPWFLARVIAGTVVLACVAIAVLLGMLTQESEPLRIRWNWHFAMGPWAFTFLSFGPALLAAPIGLARLARDHARALLPFVAITIVCALVFLFIEIPGHENTYIPFRAGHLWFLVLAATTAAAVDAARRWRRPVRLTVGALALVAALLAAPTLALDWYNARDVWNRAMSPGLFPWTVVIGPQHEVALKWLRANTRRNAVVQPDPSVRGRSTWALIPAFAERRSGVGLALFQPNPRRFDEDIARARVVFRSPNPRTAFDYCEGLKLDYLYVGPEERDAHGPNVDKFRSDPDRFTLVYDQGGVTIYRVRRRAGRVLE